MRKKKKSVLSVLVLASLAVLTFGGCMNEGTPFDMLNADAESVSVVTAVQLGAEPGCSGMSGRISGNITMIKLEEDREMALILQDGDPLCVDTVASIQEELSSLENSLSEEVPGEVPADVDFGGHIREALDGEGVEQESGGGGGDSDGTGPVRFDPDPQPALKSQVGVSMTSAAASTFTPSPSSGASGSSPNPPAGTDTPPSAPHGN